MTSTSSLEYNSVAINDHSAAIETTTKISANSISLNGSNSTEDTSTKRISALPIKIYTTEMKPEPYPNPEQIVKSGKYSHAL